ncbi:MAG: hypothetical protein GXX90_12495 [Microbacteriaceae bacterium]|nr:hypothetical protein [Microbacteriaceae bacterium]
MEPTTESGFFKASPYRVISLLIMLALAVLALNPWAFATTIGGTTVTGITLTAMQVLGVLLLIGDLFAGRRNREEADR